MLMLKKNLPVLFCIATFVISVLVMTHIPSAGELTVTKTVYIESGKVVEPRTIVQTHDNSFIIAGQIQVKGHPRSAWATKTDSDGKVAWRYLVPPRETLTDTQSGPEYFSAAVMPDDSVFLCGRMPFNPKPGNKSPGLLTHLDKDGKVLSEALIYPQNDKDTSITRLMSCMSSDDEIEVVGHAFQLAIDKEPTGSYPTNTRFDSYIILRFDKWGVLKWEKLEPIDKAIVGAPDAISQLQATADGGFSFVAVRNMTRSEVVHVTPNGDVAKKLIDVPSTMVVQTEPAKDIKMISNSTENLTRVTLDDKLHEMSSITQTHEAGEIDLAYLLPNGSVIIFGDRYRHWGSRYSARAMVVDSNLDKETSLILGASGESYRTYAATQLEKPEEYISARSARGPSIGGNHPTEAQLDKMRLGVALDFIKVKQ